MDSGPELRIDDALLALLADPNRRRMLRHLDAADGATPVTELVESLSKDADTTHSERAVAVYHCHLPRLEDCEVVERDPTGTTVDPGPRFEDAVSLLEQLDGHHEDVGSNG
jgi:DNA-binding transcriptional ArsR family regulator